MRAAMMAMVGLAVLAGCGKRSDPVGENSAGSVRTTAIGTIVGTEPTPTPTATADARAATPATDNSAVPADDNAADDD